jgi:hypothetical protein
MPRHKPLEEEVKSIGAFEGIVNAKRTKDIGHKGFTIGRNVEITDTKRVTRRSGRTLIDPGVCTAIYGTDAQNKLYMVKAGNLLDVDRDNNETVLQTGLVGDVFSWDEDPANNVYYCSNKGSSGIIMQDGTWRPLLLPIPVIQSAGVVDPGTWEYRPFALGKSYNANAMQVMATYVMADGRESGPSETVTIAVAPEVRMIRVTVPIAGASTRIYATAPGGSTYYLVGITTNPVVTLLVQNMNMTATGTEYPYELSVDSFPSDATLLQFCHGRLYAATYDATSGMGAMYASQPLQFHLFDKASEFVGLSSVPLLLLAHSEGEAMTIGTSTNVYNYTPPHTKATGVAVGEHLTEVANYGVIPGICGDVFNDIVYFWTVRGVAKMMPYELVTEHVFSGDPGVFNNAHVIHDRGYSKLVASTVSGNAVFNAWSER